MNILTVKQTVEILCSFIKFYVFLTFNTLLRRNQYLVFVGCYNDVIT